MGFSRQEYSSGQSFPSPGDLPDPGARNKKRIIWEDTKVLNIKKKMGKLDCINWTFYSSKDTIKREKAGTESETFTSQINWQRTQSKICKELINQ